jgi:hypothetical protein
MIRRKKKDKRRVRNAKESVYDGIKFRSNLELFTYKQLKKNKIKFSYEEHRFNLIESFKYTPDCWQKGKKKKQTTFVKAQKNIKNTTYLPDFCNLEDNWIIECKGLKTDVFVLKWKLFKKYLKNNNLQYKLYMPSNQSQVLETIKLIKND